MPPPKKDLINKHFGRLKVLSDSNLKSNNGHRLLVCQCECGNIVTKGISRLTTGDAKSCGACSYSNNSFVEKDTHYIGFTTKKESFIFDKDDYNLVKNITWYLNPKGYVKGLNKGKEIVMHRLIKSPQQNEIIDHINRIKTDNRQINLRVVTNQQNSFNANTYKSKVGNVSYKGVFYRKDNGTYRSIIGFNNQLIRLGGFKTPEEAAKAYDKKALELFGKYAKLNYKQEVIT